MLILNLFISSLIIIAGIIIGTQNGLAFTDVNLLWFSFKDVSLSLVIFESFIAGLVIVLIISAIYELKQGILIRRLKKNIKMLKDENKKLTETIEKKNDSIKGETDE